MVLNAEMRKKLRINKLFWYYLVRKQHLSKTDKPPENVVKQSYYLEGVNKCTNQITPRIFLGHSSQSLASETRK